MVRLATLTCVALVLFGCGSEEAPAPVETPAPTPEATPEPTPEPTPEELDPVQVFHLVLDESVSAPPTPSRSPLARDQGPPPTGLPNAAFLEADRGSRGAVEGIQALQDGYGAPGQAVVLVEWNIRWGKDGTAGQARRWGLCGLPCTLEDGFVATPGHHPVDPLTQPRPLFAHRPGAADLLIEQDGDDLRVRTGDRTLWEAGSSMDAVGGTAAVVVPSINADGQLGPELEWTAARVLTALMVTSQPIELTSRVEPVPGTVRLLPRIGAKPDTPRQRAVEAVEEVWVWADAGRFEGGFTVKPDPAASGLRLDRAGERIRWTPTTGQAGREVEFATYTLGRSARSVTVQPFPDGSVVLGSTPAVDGDVMVAAGTDFEEGTRSQRVGSLLDAFADKLPPTVTGESVGPWLVYCVDEPVGVVTGSAGPRQVAITVAGDAQERLSVARAWGRLLLEPWVGVRSAASDDFVLWAEAQLLDDRPDRSLYMSVFSAAGDDVRDVWRDWLVAPARKGAPDPSEFVDFVAGQLPELADQLRRDLPMRRLVVRPRPEAAEFDEGVGVWTADVEQPGADGAILAARLPEGASHNPVEVLVSPARTSEPAYWTAAVIPERYWDEAATDPGARQALLDRFGPTQGELEEEEEEEATPIQAPSQIEALRQARVVQKPKRVGPSSITIEPQGTPTGRSVVLVVLWGPGEWQAQVKVTARITAAEGAAQ